MRVGKPADGGEPRPPPPLKPLFPLSLSYPLPDLVDQKKIFKLCDLRLLHHVFVGIISAFLTRHVLSWCVNWANQKTKLFEKLISYPVQFITTQIRIVKCKWGKAVPWQNLPYDLSEELGERLVSRHDVLQFRSVCKNWRLSLPAQTLFPLQIPPPPASDPNSAYFITELDIYFNPVRDGNSIHIAVEGLDHVRKFRRPMVNPQRRIFNCPRGVVFMGGREHLLSRLRFVGKYYFVRKGFILSNSVQLGSRYSPIPKMVVISGSNVISSNAEGVNPSYVTASDLSVVAIFEGGSMEGRLGLLRLGGGGGGGGGGGSNWEWETGFCSRVFADIGTYKGKLSAVDDRGRVFLMDYHTLEMTQISAPSDFGPGKYGKQLFEVGGDLYLADISGKFKGAFFYKLDLQRRLWVESSNNIYQKTAKYASLGTCLPHWCENTSHRSTLAGCTIQ